MTIMKIFLYNNLILILNNIYGFLFQLHLIHYNNIL